MTLSEILKANGIDDKAAEAVLASMKKNNIFTASEENLDVRYGKLKGDHDTLTKQYGEAQTLIKNLKAANTGNEALQGKITDYEGKIQQMEKELKQTKIDAALKVALLEAKVTDVDYLTFKIKEKGEVTLEENGKIKGIDDTIAALKTQFPQHFASSAKKKIDENKLPDDNNHEDGGTEPKTLAEALQQKYESGSE